VARDYESAGACGISVLTDSTFFGGSLDDLILARAVINIPLLRKEFIIDVYQILEAKAAGADVILLIAAVLPTMEIKRLSQFAKSLQLEVLVEIHNIDELQNALHDSVDMIGVNNRNLKTFEVDINNSVLLSEKIPNDFLKISESGIDAPETVTMLRHLGYQGFLIGERFIKTKGPGNELRSFISQL
jgi:indole-3-glycerol phosphate synthase